MSLQLLCVVSVRSTSFQRYETLTVAETYWLMGAVTKHE